MTTDSFRHWQAKSIEQSQSASTTMLGLSGGALAFSASLLKDAGIYVGYYTSAFFHIHGALQLLAMGAGVWFTVNRSRDFSLTAEIARRRTRNPKDPSLSPLRTECRRLGVISRRLMFAQGILFLSAAAFFIFFILVKYSATLYPSAGG
jgi:hypothetical protein